MRNARIVRIARVLCAAITAAIAAAAVSAQTTQDKNSATATVSSPASLQSRIAIKTAAPTYVRPNFHQRLGHYVLYTYSPLRLTELAMGSAISHADDVPPDWRQGWGAYGKRFASDAGSTAIGGTTEFALAEALHVDTKYYPCECTGIWPRVGHALKSTITARAGADGHRVFSAPALAAPYAGAFSTLAWYPSRYGPKDAFRTGNYNLVESFGQSIALEFLLPVLHKIRHH